MQLLDKQIREDLFTSDRPIRAKGADKASTYIGPDGVCLNSLVAQGCRIEGTSKAMVDLAHKAGLYVSLWPGQSPEEFMRGAYLGADALNSDRAVEVKNWLDKNAPWIKYK